MRKVIVFTVIFIIVILTFFISNGQAAVELKYFQAIPGNGKVLFIWETGIELNHWGFYVNRLQSNGKYERISNFILSEEEGINGKIYENKFVDTNVMNGKEYWYKLELLDNNEYSDFSEPASAIPWDPALPTWTPTALLNTPKSLTPKPTKTKISPSKKTKTPVVIATNDVSFLGTMLNQTPPNDNLPVEGQNINDPELPPGETGLEDVTQEIQSTSTLVPLPSITLLFPTAMGRAPAEDASNVRKDLHKSRSDSWFTPQRMVILLVIATIWIMLGGWFYLSFKRLGK